MLKSHLRKKKNTADLPHYPDFLPCSDPFGNGLATLMSALAYLQHAETSNDAKKLGIWKRRKRPKRTAPRASSCIDIQQEQ